MAFSSGCVTPAIIKNIKGKLNEAEDIDGYEELTAEDQKKVQKAWAEGASKSMIFRL